MMQAVRALWRVLIAVLLAGADGRAFSIEVRESDPMLDCARLADIAKKVKCFDRVKASAAHVTPPQEPSQRQPTLQPRVEQSVETNRPGASSARQSAALAPDLVTPKSKKKDPNEILSDYALEVVRQLGKEMHPGEYPVRAREQGIGGTVQTFLHIGADGRIADVTVANSSGNDDLDHYVIGKLAKLRLPQVPGEFRGRAFTVYVPVKFAVRKN